MSKNLLISRCLICLMLFAAGLATGCADRETGPAEAPPERSTETAGAQALLRTMADELHAATNRVAELEAELAQSIERETGLQNELRRRLEEARIFRFDAVRNNPEMRDLLEQNESLQIQLEAYRADNRRQEREIERLKVLQEQLNEARGRIRTLERDLRQARRE